MNFHFGNERNSFCVRQGRSDHPFNDDQRAGRDEVMFDGNILNTCCLGLTMTSPLPHTPRPHPGRARDSTTLACGKPRQSRRVWLSRTVIVQLPRPAGVNVRATATGRRGNKTEACGPLHSQRAAEAPGPGPARPTTPRMLGTLLGFSHTRLSRPPSAKVTIKSQSISPPVDATWRGVGLSKPHGAGQAERGALWPGLKGPRHGLPHERRTFHNASRAHSRPPMHADEGLHSRRKHGAHPHTLRVRDVRPSLRQGVPTPARAGLSENPRPRGEFVWKPGGRGGEEEGGGTWNLFICRSTVHKIRTGLLSLGGQRLRKAKAKALVPRNEPPVPTASQKAGEGPPGVAQELVSASGMFLGRCTSP